MLLDGAETGDGFVSCACGQRHWGLYGAAGLLLCDPERGVLLQHRAGWTHHGQTWALPGGAVRPDETVAQAATRETEEETAVPASAVRVHAAYHADHGPWSYTTVLGTLADSGSDVWPRIANAESVGLDWVVPSAVENYPLHHDFAATWPTLRGQLGRELVLIVDAVGAVTDGWWRDRLAGLARDGLVASELGIAGVDGWRWWPRTVLAQGGDGHERIVRSVGDVRGTRPDDHVVVVTADRELRTRAAAAGAGVASPAALADAVT